MQQNNSQRINRHYSLSQPVLRVVSETSQQIEFDNEEKQQLPPTIDEKQYYEALPILKKTWKELMRNQIEVSQNLYRFVLEKDISMSRLFIHTRIDRQAVSFMTMLDTVIGYLDDQKTMDERLEELGRIHSLRYGVKAKHYKHFRTAFMKAISNYIPMNNRRENAWLWFWNHIISVMSVHDENDTAILSFNLSPAKTLQYISAIHDSLDNVIDQSPFEFVRQFYQLSLSEQPEIAAAISQVMELESGNARFISMLRHTIRLLDEQSAFQKKVIALTLRYHAYCNLNANQFEQVIKIFVRVLKQSNGRQWKSIHEESWQWLSHLVIQLYAVALRTKQ